MHSLAVLMGLGAAVGFCIGLTGVGGGSLMTPILLYMGIPAPTAIGTDLLYATLTKSGSALIHWRHRQIQQTILLTQLMGSIPASLLTLSVVRIVPIPHTTLMLHVLAFMLALTGASLLWRRRLIPATVAMSNNPAPLLLSGQRLWLTWMSGVILGILVTLSSVGAGAVGLVLMMKLYPELGIHRSTATDVAHAVLLSAVAGIGHGIAHHVDLHLLVALSSTSIPAMVIGTRLNHKTPQHILRAILGSILLLAGIRFVMI